MASDPTLLFIKASAVDAVLKKLPKDCPSWREADIQTAKLKRMLYKFLKKFENNLGPLRRGDKAFRKAYGEEVRKLGEQAKKMNRQLDKVMEEWFIRDHPEATRKSFRLDMSKANRVFDTLVYEAKHGYMKQLAGLMETPSKILKN